MNYGIRIKEIRERVGMTQVELSEISGISQEHISRIENGKFTPGLGTAERIARAMGVALNDLLKEPEE